MINHLRADGEFLIFMLQHWSEKEGRWIDSGLDAFGHPEGFTASGECWQLTGIHGTFDEGEALAGAAQLQRRHGIPFRVQVLEVSQRRYPLPRRTELDRHGRLVDLERPVRTPVRAWIERDRKALLEDLRQAAHGGSVEDVVRKYLKVEVPQTVSEMAAVAEVQES